MTSTDLRAKLPTDGDQALSKPPPPDVSGILSRIESVESKLGGLCSSLTDQADIDSVVGVLNAAGDRFLQQRLAEVEKDVASASSEGDRNAILAAAAGRAVADLDSFVAGIDGEVLTSVARAARLATDTKPELH